MNSKTNKKDKYLEVHIQYELKQFQSKNFQKDLDELLNNIFNEIKSKNISNYISIKNLKKTFLLNHESFFQNPHPLKLSRDLNKKLIYELFSERNDSIDDFSDPGQIERILVAIFSSEKFTKEIIHALSHSKLYGHFITDILYKGIVNFLSQRKDLLGKMPVANTIFKLGKNFIQDNFQETQKGFGENILKFLNNSLQKTAQNTEKYLLKAFDEDLFKKLSEEVWDFLQQKNLSSIPKTWSVDNYDLISDSLEGALIKAVGSDAFTDLSLVILEESYNYLKTLNFENILEILGIKQKDIKKSIIMISQDLRKELLKSGFIEKEIRKRLEKYYNSEEFLSLL